jgi:pimeloyl-ACP methyl ester carboxylesterase
MMDMRRRDRADVVHGLRDGLTRTEDTVPSEESAMSATSSTRRDILAISATAGVLSVLPANFVLAADDNTIRSFKINVPEEQVVDLRRRIAATRWPDRETVADQSQGVQLAKLQELVRYWGTDYDWRKIETKLNALPQFVTTIDGVDIHFIHVRSRNANALPVIITHGWPGSVIEQLKLIDPLTNPTAHGGSAEDAFDVVIPSLPGYGFSGRPTGAGWDPDRIARAWAELMKRLGYTRYVAQGGDWGSPVSSAMARQTVAGLLGIHINLPATVPPEVAAALGGGPVPAGLSDTERAVLEALMAKREERKRRVFHDDDRAAADGRLRSDGLTGGPRGLAPCASRLFAVVVRRRPQRVTNER